MKKKQNYFQQSYEYQRIIKCNRICTRDRRRKFWSAHVGARSTTNEVRADSGRSYTRQNCRLLKSIHCTLVACDMAKLFRKVLPYNERLLAWWMLNLLLITIFQKWKRIIINDTVEVTFLMCIVWFFLSVLNWINTYTIVWYLQRLQIQFI